MGKWSYISLACPFSILGISRTATHSNNFGLAIMWIMEVDQEQPHVLSTSQRGWIHSQGDLRIVDIIIDRRV